MSKKKLKDNKPIGRVNTRYNEKRGTSRLRFTSVHPDQMETILAALEIARNELGTEYDVVALDAICTHFLTTFNPAGAPKPQHIT